MLPWHNFWKYNEAFLPCYINWVLSQYIISFSTFSNSLTLQTLFECHTTRLFNQSNQSSSVDSSLISFWYCHLSTKSSVMLIKEMVGPSRDRDLIGWACVERVGGKWEKRGNTAQILYLYLESHIQTIGYALAWCSDERGDWLCNYDMGCTKSVNKFIKWNRNLPGL